VKPVKRRERIVLGVGIGFILFIIIVSLRGFSRARAIVRDRPCEWNLMHLGWMLAEHADDRKMSHAAIYSQAGWLVTNQAVTARYMSVSGQMSHVIWKGVGNDGVPICDQCGKTYEGRTSPPASTSLVYMVIWDREFCHNGKRIVLLSDLQRVHLSPEEFRAMSAR